METCAATPHSPSQKMREVRDVLLLSELSGCCCSYNILTFKVRSCCAVRRTPDWFSDERPRSTSVTCRSLHPTMAASRPQRSAHPNPLFDRSLLPQMGGMKETGAWMTGRLARLQDGNSKEATADKIHALCRHVRHSITPRCRNTSPNDSSGFDGRGGYCAWRNG
jgi:hypothetical protein